MEDSARLALLEQYIPDKHFYFEVLEELLNLINNILQNPHDRLSRVLKNDLFTTCMYCPAFVDYLRYLGFVQVHYAYIYPMESTLGKLQSSQEVIKRKLIVCRGSVRGVSTARLRDPPRGKKKKQGLEPSFIPIRLDPFLVSIRSHFNFLLEFENEELLEKARNQIPVVSLQALAVDRMRFVQERIKTGELDQQDMSFELAFLIELVLWFKYKFFSWVNKPPCETCGGETKFITRASTHAEGETCSVESYRCMTCPDGAQFVRYTNPAQVLRRRRGRCGEWANCFTLICRSLHYDTRFVYDVTDHIWCEVFMYETNSWLHVDPSEGIVDKPLMYTHGWGKTLTYVIAYSSDDIQDVTWRYTTNHKEVLKLRKKVSEQELLNTMLALRAHRHAQLSPARRNYLTKRCLRELVDLMVEKKPSDYEYRGRISGSKEWRALRGEMGKNKVSQAYEFFNVGEHSLRYTCSTDEYNVSSGDLKMYHIKGWANGVFASKNIFRKVENDWKQTYLARYEGTSSGRIDWLFYVKDENLIFNSLSISTVSALFETGCIDWWVRFDEEEPILVYLGEAPCELRRQFRRVAVRACLSGGRGSVGWQHAQLFRQDLSSTAHTFLVKLFLTKKI